MQGDIILVGLRDYQDEKADVILKCAPMLLQPLHAMLLLMYTAWQLGLCYDRQLVPFI